MFRNQNIRTLFIIWFGWVVLTFAYQAYITARMDIARPDYALEWTPTETLADSNTGKPFLIEPFLNEHVAWDSEYYDRRPIEKLRVLSVLSAGHPHGCTTAADPGNE